jgi:hypothetical protein
MQWGESVGKKEVSSLPENWMGRVEGERPGKSPIHVSTEFQDRLATA